MFAFRMRQINRRRYERASPLDRGVPEYLCNIVYAHNFTPGLRISPHMPVTPSGGRT